MKLFKTAAKYSNIKVVLDIRSSSVAAGVLTHKKGESPIIHWTKRERILPEGDVNIDTLVKGAYKKIDNFLLEIISKGIPAIKKVKLKDKAIDEVYCVFSSPWYESKIRNFDIKGKKDIHFTKEYFNNILNKEKETDTPIEGRVQVDKKILSILMNGYETEEPFDKVSNNLTFSFYSSFVSEKTINDLESKIKKYLHTRNIHFSTHPLVTISAIKNIFHSVDSFLLIDVGGEITDISLFKNSVLKSIVTVPEGSNSFIRNLSKKCMLDKENAISQLKIVCDDRFDKKLVEPTSEILNELKAEYLKKIKNSISSWKKETIPQSIFVTVDNEVQDVFKNILSSKESYVDTFRIKKEPMLHVINTQTIKDLCKYGEDARSDAILAVISNYFVNIYK